MAEQGVVCPRFGHYDDANDECAECKTSRQCILASVAVAADNAQKPRTTCADFGEYNQDLMRCQNCSLVGIKQECKDVAIQTEQARTSRDRQIRQNEQQQRENLRKHEATMHKHKGEQYERMETLSQERFGKMFTDLALRDRLKIEPGCLGTLPKLSVRQQQAIADYEATAERNGGAWGIVLDDSVKHIYECVAHCHWRKKCKELRDCEDIPF